jgi:4-hydroxy-tetrahydrodipicolinate synthase
VAPPAQLGAILTAMVTPFDRDGELSEESARRLARHLVDHGSDGIVVAGTTGESPTLSDDEKLRLLDVVLDEVGDDATVIFGSGSNDTAHSVHLTAEGTRHGAHAVLVVTPYYNKPSRRGLVAHFGAVAGATDKPMMLYNIPGRCVINLEPDLLAELGEIENVVAVKQANADPDQARQIVENGRLALYAGDDNLICGFAEIGGAGGVCVTSHLLGDRVKEMYDAARRGDPTLAREIDAELQDAYETLFMTVGTTMAKAALNLLDFDVGGLRLPLVEATPQEREAVREMLERHGLLTAAAR